MKLNTYLNNPYPSVKNKWRVIVPVSLFVSLFVLIFQPFGLQQMEGNYRILVLAGYGAITFVVLILNLFLVEAIFRNFFSERNRTIGKQIGWQIWLLFNIGLANYMYSVIFISGISSSFRSLILFQVFTLAIGVFPVTIVTIVTHNYLLKKNMQSASVLKGNINFEMIRQESGAKIIKLIAENGRDTIIVSTDSLMYIESVGNYAAIHWSGDGKAEKKLLRNTLKDIGKQVAAYPEIVQCHRAYLVNMLKIADVKGNAQGYQLLVSDTKQIIPVSRNYIQSFNRSFMENS